MATTKDPLYPPTFFKGTHWRNHPTYSLCDWQIEVANDDTRLGYAEWCLHKWESDNL